MKKRRTRYFRLTLLFAGLISCAFLVVLWLFGTQLAALSLMALIDSVFVLSGLAAASFLIFSFFPYFQGDRRWYAISALLTVAFFVGGAIVWRLPIATGTVA
ncbi:MAG: hypothetical protein E7637_02950 [Ruminococcaceae bacterium]|nr:hypothetical protein [Oscillospiraceae bacterium]